MTPLPIRVPTRGVDGLRGFTLCAFAGLALLSASNAYSQTANKANSAEADFKTNCSMCHGDDGSGTTLGKRMGAPDLRSKEVQDMPAAALEKIVSEGKGNMPAFGARLSNAQIHGLVEYIRTFRAAPPNSK